MRLAVFVDAFPELSETFILNEVKALAAEGVDVQVEAGARSRRPNPDAAGTPPVVYWDEPGSRSENLKALAWLAVRRPLRVLRDLDGRRRWRRDEAVRPLRRLAGISRRVAAGSDHIHAHFAGAAALDAMRISLLTGIPYSVTTHAYDIFLAPANLDEKLERARFHVAVCEYNAEFLRHRVPRAAGRMHKVVMGVDPEQFKRTRPYPGGRNVVAVGRLIEKKGFAHLIEAARRLPDVQVKIAGDGVLRSQLEATAPPNVELLGALPPTAVRELLERADLLALPCVIAADGDRDSMPVVVKEALAMEIPVVGSDEVGMPEMVQDGWGKLVSPGDAEALAAAIAELLALPAHERVAMGRRGREYVVRNFSVRGEALKLVGILERELG
ncbi:MAG TPA: glycosyltransferase [Thermoleophilaceae bacterium]|nr:glycosyltransferase [Thermoleophilaceae bacterium]